MEVEEVNAKKDLIEFIKFPMRLYRNNPFYVPPIIDFELSTLSHKKNPAFEHCEAKYWIIKKKKKIVGRVAGIIHQTELDEGQLVRFGWIDFIDNHQVSEKLIELVSEWGKDKGANKIHGPLGFTDLDFEGTLIDGFDQVATQASIYNFPYYQAHFERLGFEKAVDWVELRGSLPPEMPKKIARTASIVASRFKLTAKKFKRSKEILKYAPGVFDVLNRAYSHLYGYYPLSSKQIDYYVDQYFGFIRKEYVSIIVNEKDDVVGVAVSLPSLSKAFQKAKGKLFPFGFIHVLRAFRSNDHLDGFLIGVDPEYQKLGAFAMIYHELFKTYLENGVKYGSSGPMLEENLSVLSIWKQYTPFIDSDANIRRRCFIKEI